MDETPTDTGVQSLINKNTTNLSRYYGIPTRLIDVLGADMGVIVG